MVVIPLICNVRTGKSIEPMFARGGIGVVWGIGHDCLIGKRASVWADEKVLELDNGDSFTF